MKKRTNNTKKKFNSSDADALVAAYNQGCEEGYARAMKRKNIPSWASEGNVSPGVYIVETIDGHNYVLNFMETNFGPGDSRNSANFVDSFGAITQPHYIKRWYGPIDTRAVLGDSNG